MNPKFDVTYVDRPEVPEVFVDSIQSVVFDGQTFRVETCVTRMDEPKQGARASSRRYTAARLAFTADVAIALQNQLGGIIAMAQKGTTGVKSEQSVQGQKH